MPRDFHRELENAGMIKVMSRVAHCTDNSPLEGLLGILEREMYYRREFQTREELT